MPKHYKNEMPINYNRETFLKWLSECGNDLFCINDILSCAGSDGPDVTEKKLDDVPFSNPERIEKYLKENGYYKAMTVNMGMRYNPPRVHYLEWLKAQ